MRQEQLLSEMERLLEAGDTKAFEAFVLEHYTKLPEAVQSKLLMRFTSEALGADSETVAIDEIRQDGLSALERLQALRNEVADANLS